MVPSLLLLSNEWFMLRWAAFKPKKTLESQQARCTSEESLLVEDAFAFQKYHLSFEGFSLKTEMGKKD